MLALQCEKENKKVFFWWTKMKIVLHLQPHRSKGLWIYQADMVELVDTLDLGSSAVRCVGSTPSIRTKAYSIE